MRLTCRTTATHEHVLSHERLPLKRTHMPLSVLGMELYP